MSDQPLMQIVILPARAEDYDEVMSISGGIYKGMGYLPFRYHEWLKDPQRRMFVAKCEAKVVGFESFLLDDGGVTAVVEGLRVAPWMRGHGVASIIQKFCFNILRANHPEVKRVCLTRVENPPATMLHKYNIIHSKAVISVILPSDQLEELFKLLEGRVGNSDRSKNHSVLTPVEVLKLFDEPKKIEDLLPSGRLVQFWLPLTTHRANLELLLERNIVWIYSSPCDMSDLPASSGGKTHSKVNRQVAGHERKEVTSSLLTLENPISTSQLLHTPTQSMPSMNASSSGFLSLGTPIYPVPLENGMYRLDIDLFGNDSFGAQIHVLQQLRMGIQALPAGGSIVCFLYAEECLRTELNQFCQGLPSFSLMRNQLLLEMDI